MYYGINIDNEIIKIDYIPNIISTSKLYYCDNKFDTKPLEKFLWDENKYGIIVLDGNNFICAVLTGDKIKIMKKIKPNISNKHNKGGQSAVRFQRIRDIGINQYISKCSEDINDCYITDNKLNVNFIILGGQADLKNQLLDDNKLSDLIKKNIKKTLNISSTGMDGLNQIINQSSDIIKDNVLNQEKNKL
jgi:peptide chain release factor subunit 1